MYIIKTEEEIGLIKTSCKITSLIISELIDIIKPGITTLYINTVAEALMEKCNVVPAFKGFNGFKHSVCTTVNDCIVHGIPTKDKILNEGDIIGIDTGVIYRSYYSDTSVTVGVGEISKTNKALLNTTRRALYDGIKKASKQNSVKDISCAIHNHVYNSNFDVVKECVGHGLGKDLHEPPQIPNYCDCTQTFKLVPGMVIAVEPVVMHKRTKWYVNRNNELYTVDGSNSATFEHTVLITDGLPEVLTIREGEVVT